MRRLPVPLALILSAVPLAGEPAITITETQVEVAALAPGTEAAVFGVSRFSAGFTAATAELASLQSDLDEDGLVTWSPGQPIGAISFCTGDWALVPTGAARCFHSVETGLIILLASRENTWISFRIHGATDGHHVC